MASAPPLDALEQSDREEELASWRKAHKIPNEARLASGLVEAGIDGAATERLGANFRGEILSRVFERIVSSIGAERLTREIEASTARISELVRVIKEYTYMDQAPEQEVDAYNGSKVRLRCSNSGSSTEWMCGASSILNFRAWKRVEPGLDESDR